MIKTKLSITVIIFLSCLFGLAQNSEAASCTKYASNSGSGSTCSLGSPCSATYAFANAVAGDVWCFRGGTYNVPQRNFGDSYGAYYMPAHSGTSSSWITFQAYPSETPLFDGHKGGSGDVYGTNGQIGAKILGVQRQSYIILDGFSLVAHNAMGV